MPQARLSCQQNFQVTSYLDVPCLDDKSSILPTLLDARNCIVNGLVRKLIVHWDTDKGLVK